MSHDQNEGPEEPEGLDDLAPVFCIHHQLTKVKHLKRSTDNEVTIKLQSREGWVGVGRGVWESEQREMVKRNEKGNK